MFMEMYNYKNIIDYINLERKNPIGCSRLAPMIKMVNENKKIVEELLDSSDCKVKSNLLSFLDYGLTHIIKEKGWSEDYDLEEIYNNIIYVLVAFRDLEEEKWKISGDDWLKYLKSGKEE